MVPYTFKAVVWSFCGAPQVTSQGEAEVQGTEGFRAVQTASIYSGSPPDASQSPTIQTERKSASVALPERYCPEFALPLLCPPFSPSKSRSRNRGRAANPSASSTKS